mgnify:CR=1 FL=1
MANISLGRYAPYNTFLHRLDPRTKIISMICLMVIIFLGYNSTWFNFAIYGGLIVFIYILMRIAHITLKQLFKQLKMMWFMMLFLFIINLFTIKESIMIYIPWLNESIDHFTIPGINWTIYFSAFINTFYIFIRLALMISLTLILTSTTKPMDLTYALEWFLTPFKVVHLPVHEIAMTISLALRFIPTLLDETDRIMKAQSSRGVDFQDGKLKEKVRAIVSLIIPLFISSFQRSDELANAMEARGYDPSQKRTRYRLLKWHMRDSFSFVFSLLLLSGLITLSVLCNQNIIILPF